MTKSTHHHPAAKRGTRTGMAHKAIRPTKVAQAVGNAIWGIQSYPAARALRRGNARGG